MADIELVIKVPECFYEYCKAQTDAIEIQLAVANGTPLEKHDEEVIKETVESIWGKPPYTEMLDKIRAEILDEADYAYADFNLYKEDILNAEPDELPDDDFRFGMKRAIEIIDKYREMESKE